MDDHTRDVVPLLAWLVSLAAGIVVFTAMGGGGLAAPPVTDPGGWGQWAADRDAVVATAAVLRLVVLGLAWYLVGATTVGAVARAARWSRLVRVADALSVPVVRRVLQASLGVGLATTVVVTSTGALVPTPVEAAAPVMTPLDDEADPDLPPPGMRPLPVDTPAATAPTGDAPAPPAPATADPGGAPDHAPDTTGTVTVEVGDHLWSIAERHLGELHGSGVGDDVVTDYWHRLIEANRDRLVDRANPDLILPGQQFVLPAADPGARG